MHSVQKFLQIKKVLQLLGLNLCLIPNSELEVSVKMI